MIFTRTDRLFILLLLVLIVLVIRWKRSKNYYTHPLISYLRTQIQAASLIVYLPNLLIYLALGCLVIALLNPVLPLAEHQVMKESLDIILVLDLSSSMSEPIDRKRLLPRVWAGPTRDEKTRLDAVKEAMIDFIQRRHDDRIGLVVFSEHAYVVSPMTVDTEYLSHYVRMVDKKTLAGEGLTAIGEGIITSVNLHGHQMRESQKRKEIYHSRDKLLVVLTDGENNAGRNVYQAIQKSIEAGFKIDFIGIDIKLAPDALRLIAAVKSTGGNYYDVRDSDQLQKAYRDISLLQKGTWIAKRQVSHSPYYYPFALAAFILLTSGLALKSVPYFIEIS